MLQRSDPAFISQFLMPASVSTPAGESWRLSSVMKQVGNRRVAVMVGYAEKASWKMDVPASSRLIDANLKDQLAKIQDSLREEGGKVELPSSAQRKVTDGFEVVDLGTDKILSGGYWLPVYLPPHNPMPREGPSLYRDRMRRSAHAIWNATPKSEDANPTQNNRSCPRILAAVAAPLPESTSLPNDHLTE